MEQMNLTLQILNREFRWLWLMYVTGFDERHHCQACLKGNKSRRFKYNRSTITVPAEFSFPLDEFPARFVYLCGVTARYEDNLHIAMKPSPTHQLDYGDGRIKVSVSNAERVPISSTECRQTQQVSTVQSLPVWLPISTGAGAAAVNTVRGEQDVRALCDHLLGIRIRLVAQQVYPERRKANCGATGDCVQLEARGCEISGGFWFGSRSKRPNPLGFLRAGPACRGRGECCTSERVGFGHQCRKCHGDDLAKVP